ncbi:MAG: ATP-dependent Clp protease adaptor ClpS [Phycisphaerales bacterium]
MSDTATIDTTKTDEPKTKLKSKTDTKKKPEQKQPHLWNVVLHDDDDHSYDYVMRMMMDLFAMELERSFLVAASVDKSGRVICETTHKERAEFKRDQILGYGADPLIPRCKGSMTATIEPAYGDGDDDHDDPRKNRDGAGPAKGS